MDEVATDLTNYPAIVASMRFNEAMQVLEFVEDQNDLALLIQYLNSKLDHLDDEQQTEWQREWIRAQQPAQEKVVLWVGDKTSHCGKCGQACLPQDIRHTKVSGYNPKPTSCNALFTHIGIAYRIDDAELTLRKMRPDLIYEVHSSDRVRA